MMFAVVIFITSHQVSGAQMDISSSTDPQDFILLQKEAELENLTMLGFGEFLGKFEEQNSAENLLLFAKVFALLNFADIGSIMQIEKIKGTLAKSSSPKSQITMSLGNGRNSYAITFTKAQWNVILQRLVKSPRFLQEQAQKTVSDIAVHRLLEYETVAKKILLSWELYDNAKSMPCVSGTGDDWSSWITSEMSEPKQIVEEILFTGYWLSPQSGSKDVMNKKSQVKEFLLGYVSAIDTARSSKSERQTYTRRDVKDQYLILSEGIRMQIGVVAEFQLDIPEATDHIVVYKWDESIRSWQQDQDSELLSPSE